MRKAAVILIKWWPPPPLVQGILRAQRYSVPEMGRDTPGEYLNNLLLILVSLQSPTLIEAERRASGAAATRLYGQFRSPSAVACKRLFGLHT